jgi:hypothetical protein
MIKISKEANPNYLAKIVELKNIKMHSNAHSLQTVDIDFQTVITGMNAKDGDIYVYFPLECKINEDFLSFTNSFRDKTKNLDTEKAGFFENNCRVRAMRLRGEKSEGYIIPIAELESFTGQTGLSKYVGESFDTINNVKLLEKYVVKSKTIQEPSGGKKPKFNRIIENQFQFHNDTENFRRNTNKIKPKDTISITYKTHGSSGIVANVMVKKELSFLNKIGKFLGIEVVDKEYDILISSRRVIKNKFIQDPKVNNHFYGSDIWTHVVDKFNLRELVPKGFTLYYEILGYTPEGGWIQKDYPYGNTVGNCSIEVYRITSTNLDGFVTELSTSEIMEFCKKLGLTSSHLFFQGRAIDWLLEQGYKDRSWDDAEWEETFLKALEKEYTEKDCFKHLNSKVPEEGIVIRKESIFNFEAYKLKSFRFLEKETKELDRGEVDIEE